VVATMPVHGPTKQPICVLYGETSVVLAETVASLGTYNVIDQESQLAMRLEINANHLRAKNDGLVTAVGTPLHRGRKIMVWDVRLISASRAARSPWCRNSQSAPKGSRFTGCGATAPYAAGHSSKVPGVSAGRSCARCSTKGAGCVRSRSYRRYRSP